MEHAIAEQILRASVGNRRRQFRRHIHLWPQFVEFMSKIQISGRGNRLGVEDVPQRRKPSPMKRLRPIIRNLISAIKRLQSKIAPVIIFHGIRNVVPGLFLQDAIQFPRNKPILAGDTHQQCLLIK